MIKRRPVETLILPLAVVLCLFILFSVTRGPLNLPVWQSLLSVWDGVWGSNYSELAAYQKVVVWDLRLPRTLLALLVGALLAQCGAVMQGLFRNPLAEPGIIGVSSGAALGASFAIVFLPIALQVYAVPVAAFLGGLGVTWFVYRLAQSRMGTSVVVLLLAGVAIAAFSGAVIGFLTYIANDQALRDLSLWQMGTLVAASGQDIMLCLITLVIVSWFFQRKALALNALLLGESEARHLGIHVERLKLQFIILTAMAVGMTVSVAGIIGFVGLVVPHLVRMLVGSDHRLLLPVSGMVGGGLLLLADMGARLWLSPAELPVGLVTAALGAPFFMVLLFQRRKTLI